MRHDQQQFKGGVGVANTPKPVSTSVKTVPVQLDELPKKAPGLLYIESAANVGKVAIAG